MDKEYYQIEVNFEIAETSKNFEQGNIFLKSTFHSFREGANPLKLARTGYV